MPPPELVEASPSRQESTGRRTLAVLVLGMLVSLIWLVEPWFDFLWDSALYVLSTRSLLAGEGYTIHGDSFTLRPPGFSLLLAPVMALFGTNFLAFNLYSSAFGILAVALAFRWFRPRLGVLVAAGLCVSLWLNPQLQRICNSTLSDTPGLAALFLCLLLDRRARRSGLAWDVALGLAIGVAMQLRTVSLLLLPAIVLSRLLHRDVFTSGAAGLRRHLAGLALMAAACAAVQLPWSLWKNEHPSPDRPRTHILYSYWTAQWHRNPHSPDSPLLGPSYILERIPTRVEQCLTSLGSRMPNVDLHGLVGEEKIEASRKDAMEPLGLWVGAAAVLVLAVAAARRREADNLFAVGNLAVLFIYFDFDERLLVPVYPFVLAATVEALVAPARRVLSARAAPVALAVLVAGLGVYDHLANEDRFPLEERNRLFVTVARYVDEHYPDATVAACLGHELSVFLDRPVYFLEVGVLTDAIRGGADTLSTRNVDLVLYMEQENRRVSFIMGALMEKYGRQVAQIGYVRIFEVEGN